MDGTNDRSVNLLVEMTAGEREALVVWLREALKLYLNTEKADEAVDMYALFRMRLNSARLYEPPAEVVAARPARTSRKR